MQTVKRNGVTLTIAGEKLDYWDSETWKLLGEKVYLRYDPDDLSEVRIYEAESDRYIRTLPLSVETTIKFDADAADVALAQKKVHEVHKAIKKSVKEYKERLSPDKRIDILDMQIRRAHEGKSEFEIKEPSVIVPVISGEKKDELKKAVGETTPVIIDINRMNANASKRKE